MKLVLIDGCPCPVDIAPYVYLVLRDAHQAATSIYRGEDAKALLHAHGKHTQAEIHKMYPAISNPPGYSSHELRSDGSAVYATRRGSAIPSWQVGVDSGSDSQHDKRAIEHAAASRGWKVVHPYNRGAELHHWSFAKRPRPKGPRTLAKLVRTRAALRKATR